MLLDDTGDLTNQLVNLFHLMPDDLKANYDESIRASELVEKAIEYVPFLHKNVIFITRFLYVLGALCT